jgi:hypothetical protein
MDHFELHAHPADPGHNLDEMGSHLARLSMVKEERRGMER